MVYVEVFGGGGSVLLNKERSVREVLNDANGNLINLYRVVREHPEELKDRLLYVMHNREDFKLAQRRLAQFPPCRPHPTGGGFLPDHPAELRRQWKTVLCCGPEYVGGLSGH